LVGLVRKLVGILVSLVRFIEKLVGKFLGIYLIKFTPSYKLETFVNLVFLNYKFFKIKWFIIYIINYIIILFIKYKNSLKRYLEIKLFRIKLRIIQMKNIKSQIIILLIILIRLFIIIKLYSLLSSYNIFIDSEIFNINTIIMSNNLIIINNLNLYYSRKEIAYIQNQKYEERKNDYLKHKNEELNEKEINYLRLKNDYSWYIKYKNDEIEKWYNYNKEIYIIQKGYINNSENKTLKYRDIIIIILSLLSTFYSYSINSSENSSSLRYLELLKRESNYTAYYSESSYYTPSSTIKDFNNYSPNHSSNYTSFSRYTKSSYYSQSLYYYKISDYSPLLSLRDLDLLKRKSNHYEGDEIISTPKKIRFNLYNKIGNIERKEKLTSILEDPKYRSSLFILFSFKEKRLIIIIKSLISNLFNRIINIIKPLIKFLLKLIIKIFIIILIIYIKNFFLISNISLFWNDSLVEYIIAINNTIITNYISLLKNFNIKLIEVLEKFNFLLNSFENKFQLENNIDNVKFNSSEEINYNNKLIIDNKTNNINFYKDKRFWFLLCCFIIPIWCLNPNNSLIYEQTIDPENLIEIKKLIELKLFDKLNNICDFL